MSRGKDCQSFLFFGCDVRYQPSFVFFAALVLSSSRAVYAQANANAIRGASDAFGFKSGDDAVGIYDESSVRGYSLEAAGNYRVNGSYFVKNSGVSSFFLESTTVRIGYNTLGTAMPGPSGVVDYKLRDPAIRERSLLTVGSDSYGQAYADLLFKHRSADERFSASLGIGRVDEVHDAQGGAGGGSWLVGGAMRYTLDKATIRGFFGEYEYERPGQFRVRPPDDRLPQEMERSKFLGQRWAMERGQRRIAGLLGEVPFAEAWGVGATLVFSQEDPTRGFTQIFDDFRDDGTVRSRISMLPQQRATSYSSEIRVYKDFVGEASRQRWDITGRGRRSSSRYGGARIVDLGRTEFGVRGTDQARPDIDDGGANLQDRVEQWGLGVAYRADIRDSLRISAGLLKTEYRKTFFGGDGGAMRTRAAPTLYNLGVGWAVTPNLDLYGSSSRGLEEAGVAPATASNANAVLSAILVTQRELGLRYRPLKNTSLVMAGFDTRKPYSGIDANNGAYAFIGDVRHRGLEASVSSQVGGLKVLLGGVWIDAELETEGQSGAAWGDRPVGVPKLRGVLSADYAVGAQPGLSFDLALTAVSARAVRSTESGGGSQLDSPGTMTMNVGVRYSFTHLGLPVTVRGQVSNATDTFSWEPNAAETLTYSAPRRYRLVFTYEF